MKLFDSETYIHRRETLKEKVGSGQILIFGNDEAPMNYKDNTYRFRQDSNFLYYFGLNMPGLIGLIDIDKNQEFIFGLELTIDDIIWGGPAETLASLAEKVGITNTLPPNQINNYIDRTSVKLLPVYRGDREVFIRDFLGFRPQSNSNLIKAVVSMRAHKSEAEIVEMEKAVNITRLMHLAAMKATKPGKMEYEIVAEILKVVKENNAELSYPIIFSVNGQTLHNHSHSNIMENGRLVLNDSGCETEMYYAGDITRTFPVNGQFSKKQKEIYDIVLKMEEDSIQALKPGIMYREVHIHSNKILIDGLKDLGILKGDTDEMVAKGVGGLFMPHGLGHSIGLDVHDMEDLGEQYVGYREGLERSSQLGLKSLRLAKELETGNVLTVEPGCYFIPELIQKYRSENIFNEYVNYHLLEDYYSFGGVRIEDNILITENGHKVLGSPIPKTTEEVEDVMKG